MKDAEHNEGAAVDVASAAPRRAWETPRLSRMNAMEAEHANPGNGTDNNHPNKTHS